MMRCIAIQIILIFFTLHLHPTSGAKILGIFAYPAKSHFTFNSAILKSLANAGHEITVITSFPQDVESENYTIIDTSKDFVIQVANTTYNEFTNYSAWSISGVGFQNEVPVCHKLWQLQQVQDMMNSNEKQFDVILTEIFHLYKCYTPIAHKMNIPVIGTLTYKSWIQTDLAVGNPNNPSYIPYDIGIHWDYNDFFIRLRNALDHWTIYCYWYFVNIPFLRKFHRDHLQHMISYFDYINMEPSLMFYNTHHSYTSRPMNPNVIEVAGIHIKPAKPLPENVQKFIDGATHGVILFTFGSLVKTSTLPPNKLRSFLDAFAQIPQRVIIKYEESLHNISDNILLLEWLPQRDILEHKNVIAFISHCGQGGVYEAIYTATPIIACPLMFDQPTNAALLRRSGVSVDLNMQSVSKETVSTALNRIINDTSYRDNMNKLSEAFRDRPLTPQQSVVYWTEYIIRHNGAPHLKIAAQDLNWFQYFLLDVIGFIVFSIFIAAVLIYFSVKLFVHFLKTIINYKLFNTSKIKSS